MNRSTGIATSLLALCLATTACTPKAPEGAVLHITEPGPGEIIFTEWAPQRLQAELQLPDGSATDLTGPISWSVNTVPEWFAEGPDPLVELPPGIIELTAEAVIGDPNAGGYVASSTLGNLRVQSIWTGVYVGTVRIRVESDQGIGASCLGAIVFDVLVSGRQVVGTTQCSIDLPINFPIDLDFAVEGLIDQDGRLDGALVAGSGGFFEIDIPFDGYREGSDGFSAEFGTELLSFVLEGDFQAYRVTRYLD